MPDFNPEPWPPNEVFLASIKLDYDFDMEEEVSRTDSRAKNHHQEHAMSSDNLSKQSCNLVSAMGNTASFNSQFDQHGLLAKANPNDPPHNCSISGSVPGQADVQDDTGSKEHTGVYSSDDFDFARYSKLDAFEPLVSDQGFYQFGNTNGVEDSHRSNQRAIKQERERAEGLQESLNGFFEISPHANALLTQGADEAPHIRNLLDKSEASNCSPKIPVELQIMIWKLLFPAGRATFIDFDMYGSQIKADERYTGLPITLAICKLSRQVTMEHYTIVDRHDKDMGPAYTEPFCFNPEVDTLCISYNFREPFVLEEYCNDWYDKVDEALKESRALKGVGLKGVRFLDVRDVVTGLPVDTSNISWFLPGVYKKSFLSRFENLERLVFTSAKYDELGMYEGKPGGVALDSLGECELFWEELAEYLEKQKDSHKDKLVAKEKIIVREYEAPQGIRALEGLEIMYWLF